MAAPDGNRRFRPGPPDSEALAKLARVLGRQPGQRGRGRPKGVWRERDQWIVQEIDRRRRGGMSTNAATAAVESRVTGLSMQGTRKAYEAQKAEDRAAFERLPHIDIAALIARQERLKAQAKQAVDFFTKTNVAMFGKVSVRPATEAKSHVRAGHPLQD